MKNVILISAFDPDEDLVDLIKAIMKKGEEYISDIIVVNDGSGERTHYVFRRLKSIGIRVISKNEKAGMGAACRAGFQLIEEKDILIDGILVLNSTKDCSAEDILNVARMMHEHRNSAIIADSVINRDISLCHRLICHVNSWLLKRRTGVKCFDPTRGVIGIPAELLNLAMTTSGKDYRYGFNLICGMARSGAPVTNLKFDDLKNCGTSDMKGFI